MQYISKLSLLTTTAALAFSLNVAHAAEQADGPCIVAGKEMPVASDGSCQDDVLATLRAYSYKYSVEKRDENGAPVLDENGQAVMEEREETFALMAQLIEDAGLSEQIASGDVTVFAVPDSVLADVVADWQSALQDEERKAEAFRVVATHVVRDKLPRNWFRAANGKIWTLAGNWRSGTAPISFHDLTAGLPLRVNDVAVGNADIQASNGVIHVVATPLAAVAPKVEVAAAQ